MNLLLLRSGEPPNPFAKTSGLNTHPDTYSPEWEMLCIQAYIHERSKHRCDYIDSRTVGDLETEFEEIKNRLTHALVIGIYAPIHCVRQVMGIIEVANSILPNAHILLWGPLATRYPQLCLALPKIKSIVRGDAEKSIKDLLDFFDNPKRLARVPGLSFRNQDVQDAVFFDDLTPYSYNIDWKQADISSLKQMQQVPRRHGNHVNVRCSRGNNNTGANRFYGEAYVPCRMYPFTTVADSMQRASSAGVSYSFIEDPPGFWDEERMLEWCAALKLRANSQPWGFQCTPHNWSQKVLEELQLSACRRIHIIIPSANLSVLEEYGIPFHAPTILKSIKALIEHKIQVVLHVWIGGPDSTPKEASEVYSLLESLNFTPHVLKPFPLVFDSAFYLERLSEGAALDDTEWINNVLEPDQHGFAATWHPPEETEAVAMDLNAKTKKSARRLISKSITRLFNTNWIEELERRAIGDNQLEHLK